MNEQKSDLFVSVVAPLSDAGYYVEQFVIETARLLAARFKDYEIVLIDNASRDDTVARVERVQSNTKNVQLYCLVRPIDEEAAFIVGLEQAIGDVVITMDPRTDPPALIPEFLEPLKDGTQIVYGQLRNDDLQLGGRLRRAILQFASWWVRRQFDVSIDTSTFRLMSRKVINSFLDNSDRYALFAVIASFTGYRHSVVHYHAINITGGIVQRPLILGVVRSLRIMLLASKWPLRLLMLFAVVGATLNLIYSAYIVVIALFVGGVAEGWTSLSLQVASMFFIMFVILGVLSDYVQRLVLHNQNRPSYLIVREKSSLVLSRKQELNVMLSARRDRSPNEGADQGADK